MTVKIFYINKEKSTISGNPARPGAVLVSLLGEYPARWRACCVCYRGRWWYKRPDLAVFLLGRKPVTGAALVSTNIV